MQQLIEQIEQAIAHRKQFELNIADIDSWLKKTEFELAKSLKLDAGTAAVTMTMNKYEVQIRFIGIFLSFPALIQIHKECTMSVLVLL